MPSWAAQVYCRKHRGSSLIFNLAVNVLSQARDEGVDTVILQTTLGPIFERFLRICGFKLAFKRTGYYAGMTVLVQVSELKKTYQTGDVKFDALAGYLTGNRKR